MDHHRGSSRGSRQRHHDDYPRQRSRDTCRDRDWRERDRDSRGRDRDSRDRGRVSRDRSGQSHGRERSSQTNGNGRDRSSRRYDDDRDARRDGGSYHRDAYRDRDAHGGEAVDTVPAVGGSFTPTMPSSASMSADGLGIGDANLGGASGGVVTLPFPAPTPAVVPGLGRPKRGDWACHKCHALNFARRDNCFGCGIPGGGTSIKGFSSLVPTKVLRISGLRRGVTADDVVQALKEFAPVADAHIVGDTYSGRYLPICYAEFSSVEHAQHTLDTAGGGRGLVINGATAPMTFAANGKAPSSSSESANKNFQQRQTAARLAELESAEVGQESRERDEARQQAREEAANEARVDTGNGRGTGSLAMAFDEPFDQKASTSAGVVTLGMDHSGSGTASNQSAGNAVRAAAEGLEDGEVMILKESGGASREVVMAALNKMLNPPQWPPSFQEAGAAYTFDAASGYFYESSTGVYYDPKSKLYCKDSRWHQHTPGQNPAFTPVDQSQNHQQQQQHQQHEEQVVSSTDTSTSTAATPATSLTSSCVTLPIMSLSNSAANTSADPTSSSSTTTTSSQPPTLGQQATTTTTNSSSSSNNGSSDNNNLKRAGVLGGGSKKQKIAFGFKGIKLNKSAGGGGGGASVGSAGDGTSGGSNGDTGAGSLKLGKNKRLLQDVSKWNARKLEEDEEHSKRKPASAQPLHIAPRKRSSPSGASASATPPPSYDPPAPLLPPLPAPLSHLKIPSAKDTARSSTTSAVVGGSSGHGRGGGGGVSERATVEAVTDEGHGGGQAGDVVVVACLLCRRSFASAEMLVKHERKSKLHRENLAKAAVEAGGTAGGDTKGSARVAVT